MLFVCDGGQKYPITNASDFYITHVDGGIDTLSFSILTDDPIYGHLAEENRVEYGDNDYILKSIDAPSSLANIKCEIDLDFLKENFHKAYDSGSVTLPALLKTLLPDGWTVSGYNPGISRTISLEGATGYDIMKQALKTYSVAFKWQTLKKTITVINPNDKTPSGEYLTDELNLRSIAFKGESTDFITRLYPYGKDGMTIADVNGGIEYVENHQYSDKVICGYWKDERYTVTADLKNDAKKKLASLSIPARSYDCDVIDLAKLDSRYKDFEFSMYKVVTLIDRKRKLRLDYQIMEYQEYPEQPENNVLTLSSVVSTVQDNITQAQRTADNAQQSADEANNGIEEAKTEITQLNGEITLKADKGKLIAEINISPETIKISADKLELSGLVTISNLENGDTTIDGACIKTGKIESQDGSWWLDLENGKFYLSKGTFAGEAVWEDSDGNEIGSIICAGQEGLEIGGSKVSIESPDLLLNAQSHSPVYIKNLEVGNDMRCDGNIHNDGNLYVNGDKGLTTNVGITMSNKTTRTLHFTNGILTDNDA